MLKTHRYSCYGVMAILLWSCLIALSRSVSEQLGPIGGAASLYTVSSILLVFTMGLPKISRFSKSYLLIGGSLFVCYEIFLALALGMANSRHQAIEMAVINYLWPALTVLFAVLLSKKKTNLLVYPSIVLAFFGVAWSISGDQGLSVQQIAANVATNPLTYSMAFFGAIIWAVYCNYTQRVAKGQNAIVLFFIATAVTLWIKYALSDEPAMVMTTSAAIDLVLAGAAMGAGYALWNTAILGGNMVFLATMSYFTPIFSTLFSSMLLGLSLTVTFLQGVCMVTIGSLACWWVTREKPTQKASVKSESSDIEQAKT